MSQEIKNTLDFKSEGNIINIPDGVNDQDAVNVRQLNNAILNGISGTSGKYLISGGAVWSGTGLTYDTSYISFFWNGNKLASPTSLTLADSDATNNRLDAIVVDEAGNVTVITGTASASPITPAIPEDQLLVQYILVEAGTTEPDITQESIYLNNAEWTFANYTTSGSQVGTSNADATDSPKEGTKCIDNSLDPRTGIRFSRATSLDITPYTTFAMWIRIPAAIDPKETLLARFENTSFTPIGNQVDLFSYGIQKTVLGTWQLAIVPVSAFGVTTVQGFRLIMTGGKNNVQVLWDADLITLTDGSTAVTVSPNINFYKDSAIVGSQKGLDLVEGIGMGIDAVIDPFKQTVKYTLTPDTNKAYVDAADAILQTNIDAKENAIAAGTTAQYWRGDKTWQTLPLPVWGGITGSINDQTDLISGGKILASLLPAIAITDTSVVGSEAEMLALAAETGDIAVRTDETKTYILKGTDPSVLADWELLLTPTGGVVSVFGRTGAVTAQSGDYTFAQIASTPTTLAGYGITDAYPLTGNPSGFLTTVSFSSVTGTASPTQGGTGLTSYAKGDVIVATGTNVLGIVSAATTDGYVFTWDAASGLPMWKVASGGGSSLPSMTGNANKWLTTDGTTASWQFNTGWSTTGNAGTDGGITNFIGTTDNKNLVVKTNNIKAFTVTTAAQAIIMGDGNTPSKEYIYFRNIGSVGSSVGIGLTSGYGMGFFTGTNNAVFRWISGGISGTDLMSLGASGLNVTGNITLSGTISGVTSLTISGTLAATLFKSDGSFNVPKIYYRYLGATTNTGVGYQLVSGVGSVQYFARSADTGWSWTYGGDLQTNSANVQMNLTTVGLSVLTGVVAGTISNINSSAIIEGRSTTQGFLPPRMTTTQVNAIATPAEALQAYDLTVHGLKLNNGTVWNNIVHSNVANAKVTSGAPFTNDGYIVVTIGGVDYKLMTTT